MCVESEEKLKKIVREKEKTIEIYQKEQLNFVQNEEILKETLKENAKYK